MAHTPTPQEVVDSYAAAYSAKWPRSECLSPIVYEGRGWYRFRGQNRKHRRSAIEKMCDNLLASVAKATAS